MSPAHCMKKWYKYNRKEGLCGVTFWPTLACTTREVLSAKSSLVGHNVTCNLLSSFLEGYLDMIGLFQAFFDYIVWHAIGTQRCPASIPVKLGRVLCLDKIWHRHDLHLSWLESHVGLDCISTRSLGWEIRLEFCGIPRLIQFRTFWTPEFSSEFYFSDLKMCSRQFWTCFFPVRNPLPPSILPISWINKHSRYISCQWHNFVPNLHLLTLSARFPLSVSRCRFVFHKCE